MISEKSSYKSKLIVTFTIMIVCIVLAAFESSPISALASTINLPQTGQTSCYDATGNKITCTGTRQDGDVKAGIVWPNPRFTDNGDQTMTDNLTGLVWAKDAGTPTVGSCIGGEMAWTNALDYVACLNTANYLGHKDWRLPNINELESLVNTEQSNPDKWLGTQGYINIQLSYWSSTTDADFTSSARFVFMWSGYVGTFDKSSNSYIWPVRTGQSGSFGNSAIWATGQTQSYHAGDDGAIKTGTAWPNPRFIDNGDGTVTDNLTGLMWTKNANLAGGAKNWQQALDYVASLNSGSGTYGHADWRLPNVEELRSLVDYSKYEVALPAGNPCTNVQLSHYWSSTTYAPYSSFAWYVYLWDGDVDSFPKSEDFYVWPVRAGQVGNSVNLIISKSGTGSGTVTGSDSKINCGSICNWSYSLGTGVTLTASASSGSTFTGWSGGGCSGTSFCTLAVNSDTTITATFNANTTPTPTPSPSSRVDKAIIVSGGGPFSGNSLWDSTIVTANNAYKALTAQGFTKDTIKYLSADTGNPFVTDAAKIDNLKSIMDNWASDANDVVIYFTDHGGYGTFTMGETDILQAATFKNWLDGLQTKISGMIIFVYDACESGSFIAYLTPPEGKKRILISSAKLDQNAYFLINGVISFSTYFWNQVRDGADIYTAFVIAKQATRNGAGVIKNQYNQEQPNQEPQIDDNGNGIPNETGYDGELAKTKHIGKGTTSASGVLTIKAAYVEPQILAGSSSARINVDDTDISHTETLQNVWAIIIPPGYSTGSSAIPVTDLPMVELQYESIGKHWEETYTHFTASGDYTVSVYATDNKGGISMPVSTTVTQTVSSASNPKPAITVNGKTDSSVNLTTSDTLTLAVSLDPGTNAVEKADWWLYAYTPYGTFYFDSSSGWKPGYAVTYGGALFNLPQTPVLTLPLKGLQSGNYVFIFEIDTNPDGIRDGDIYTSSVNVNVK
ncbi:MAG: DUF1566 domain-containing protein [Nitrospirae bacterium]|nr:DUF1566 domain-containing protein [Nitrospirota bacterium]